MNTPPSLPPPHRVSRTALWINGGLLLLAVLSWWGFYVRMSPEQRDRDSQALWARMLATHLPPDFQVEKLILDHPSGTSVELAHSHFVGKQLEKDDWPELMQLATFPLLLGLAEQTAENPGWRRLGDILITHRAPGAAPTRPDASTGLPASTADVSPGTALPVLETINPQPEPESLPPSPPVTQALVLYEIPEDGLGFRWNGVSYASRTGSTAEFLTLIRRKLAVPGTGKS